MNDINEIFDSLETIEIDPTSPSDAFKKIQGHYFKIFTDLLFQFRQFELKQNTKLFRVRKNVQDLAFINLIELSHPPRHLTNFGRVNLKNKPYYYCSDKLSTAILELKPEENEYFTLSECILIEDLLLAVLGDHSRYKTVGDESDNLKKFYERVTPIITRPIKKDLEYLFTATLADVIFSDMKFGGIMYPSFYAKNNADNFALRTDGLNRKLIFQNARLFKVVKKANQHHVTIKCVAKTNKISIHGEFIWEGINNCQTHSINFDQDLNEIVEP